MRTCRLVRCLSCPIFLLALASGCQALHSYRPVAIEVRDAETHQPIPSADVAITYPGTQPSFAPWNSSGTTGADGIVRLQAAPCGDATGISVEMTAKGYLFEQKILLDKDVAAIAPAHLFETVEKRPVSFVLEMVAGPSPTVELIVPAGYRGLVKAEVHVQDDLPCPAGQRCFSYVVPPSGEVQVTGPRLLRRVFAPDFQARYADGTVLDRQAKDSAVGVWCLKSEETRHVFLVGTQAEYEERRQFYQKEETRESRPASSGRGGGRGRHKPAGDAAP
jgi:hypothetical protein